jgi:thiamine-monophosphate kinase
VDLSDGLGDGVARLAESSGVGIAIDAATVPLDPDAQRWFELQGQDPVAAAIAGGDDYELLLTVRPRLRGRLKAALLHGGVPLTRIGVCTADAGLALVSPGSDHPSALPAGFSHFR